MDDSTTDQPGWGLVMPFVVCASAGGPYEDQAFVAGYTAGLIDQALTMAAAVGSVDTASWTVPTDLIRQLELIGMRHGYPTMHADIADGTPQWTYVTFHRAGTDQE